MQPRYVTRNGRWTRKKQVDVALTVTLQQEDTLVGVLLDSFRLHNDEGIHDAVYVREQHTLAIDRLAVIEP